MIPPGPEREYGVAFERRFPHGDHAPFVVRLTGDRKGCVAACAGCGGASYGVSPGYAEKAFRRAFPASCPDSALVVAAMRVMLS